MSKYDAAEAAAYELQKYLRQHESFMRLTWARAAEAEPVVFEAWFGSPVKRIRITVEEIE